MTRDVGFKIRRGKVGILLLHRLCGTPVEMRFVATGLASKGYTVHCPMLAGHCGSEDALRASTWTDWYRGASLALDDIKKDCDVVIAGGLSAGAVLAVMLAARNPAKVNATALLAPTLWLNGWMIPWYARLFKLIRTCSGFRIVIRTASRTNEFANSSRGLECPGAPRRPDIP